MAYQESGRPYNSPGECASQSYRTPTNSDDAFEINPRAEISTSVGNQRQINPNAEMSTSVGSQRLGSGLHTHPFYTELVDFDQPASRADYEYTARVRRDSDSPVYHSPVRESCGPPGLVLEECVPNSRLDPSAARFRERLPDVSTYEGRIGTFNGWHNAVIDKEVLAEAGFYYSGTGDNVICARCSRSLSNWTSGDDPRQQHLDHFGVNCF